MRKFLLIGAGLVVVAVAGAFGGQWYGQKRATEEVDRLLAGLRTNGTTASHGPVSFSLWSRRLEVPEIAIATPAGLSLKLSKVAAEGISLLSKDFAAARLAAAGLELALPPRGPTTGVSTYAVPELSATTVRVGKPHATPGGDGVDIALAVLQATDVAALSAPQVSSRVTSGSVDVMSVTYTGVEAKGIRDGKLGGVAVANTVFAAGTGPSAMSGRMQALSMADIDLVTILGRTNPARTEKDGYVRIQGPLSAGPLEAKMAGPVEMSFERMSADGMSIDPKRFSIAEYQSLSTDLPPPGREPTPGETAAALERMAALYDGSRLGKFEIAGMKIAVALPPPQRGRTETSVGVLRVRGLDDGKLAELAVESLRATGGPAPLVVSRFALKGIAIAELMRLSGNLAAKPGVPPDPQKLAAMLGMLEGFEVAGVDVPNPETGQPHRIETLAAKWGNTVDGTPTKITLSGTTSTSLDPSQPHHKMLIDQGLAKVEATFALDANWDEATKAVRITPALLSFGELADIRADVTLGNVPRTALALSALGAAKDAFELGRVELEVVDKGMIARSNPADRTALMQQLTFMREQTAASPNPHPNLLKIVGGIEALLAAPGKSLTVTLAPKDRITLGEFLPALASPTFPDLLERTAIEVTVK